MYAMTLMLLMSFMYVLPQRTSLAFSRTIHFEFSFIIVLGIHPALPHWFYSLPEFGLTHVVAM